jgi:aspartate-semialdehyde dehydrogenase
VNALREAPGLSVKYGTAEEDYPTALTDGDGEELVQVGRIRKDLWSNDRVNIWVVADNLLKGAALNSIQIAELLFE